MAARAAASPNLLQPADVNAAIADLMTHLNEQRPIRRLGATRRQLLETVDRPSLRSLPAEPYEFSEWRTCRVGIDYHVEVAAHYYSVPHRFARTEVDARLTARTVEIFLKGERIAVHVRASGNHKHTTVSEHMPSSHRRYAGWTIERIRADARLIGPATAALCELILETRPHPEQGFRACLGIVRLAGPHGAERLEAAAERAIDIGARTYGSVKSILDNNLDRRPARQRAADGTPILHATSVARATTIRRDDLLEHPTLDQLNALGLHGMAKAFVEIAANGQANGLGHQEWLGLLLDREASWRQDKRFAARLRVAKLRQQASVEDVDYRSPRGLDRALFQKLVEGEWINAHDNLVLVGPTGFGKVGRPQRLATKPVATIGRSSISERPVCSRICACRGECRHPRILRNLAEPTFSSG